MCVLPDAEIAYTVYVYSQPRRQPGCTFVFEIDYATRCVKTGINTSQHTSCFSKAFCERYVALQTSWKVGTFGHGEARKRGSSSRDVAPFSRQAQTISPIVLSRSAPAGGTCQMANTFHVMLKEVPCINSVFKGIIDMNTSRAGPPSIHFRHLMKTSVLYIVFPVL